MSLRAFSAWRNLPQHSRHFRAPVSILKGEAGDACSSVVVSRPHSPPRGNQLSSSGKYSSPSCAALASCAAQSSALSRLASRPRRTALYSAPVADGNVVGVKMRIDDVAKAHASRFGCLTRRFGAAQPKVRGRRRQSSGGRRTCHRALATSPARRICCRGVARHWRLRGAFAGPKRQRCAHLAPAGSNSSKRWACPSVFAIAANCANRTCLRTSAVLSRRW